MLLLLLQLAHHPTKYSGRSPSLLPVPNIPRCKAATDIAHFWELVGKGNFMGFKIVIIIIIIIITIIFISFDVCVYISSNQISPGDLRLETVVMLDFIQHLKDPLKKKKILIELVCLHLKTLARHAVIDYIDRVLRRMWAVLVNTIFWISLRHGCPGILFVNSSVPLFITPSAPITTGIMVTFIPHIFWISISEFLVYCGRYVAVNWYGHIYQ